MASKEPLISIIVPIYNVAEYLPRCLDSILNQTYKNFEAILVDDGSTDDSKLICQEYSKNDKRFILVEQKNGGVSRARNSGIDKATGDYITFIDPDDYANKDYLGFLLRTAKKHNSDVAACGHVVHYTSSNTVLNSACGKEMLLSPEKAIKAMLYETYPGLGVSLWAKLFDKKLFCNIRFPEGDIFEDTAVVFELISSANSVEANLRSKYNYIMRNDSITNQCFRDDKLDMIKSTKSACDKILKRFPKLKCATHSRMIYAHLSTLSQAAKSEVKPPRQIAKGLISYVRLHGLMILFNKNVRLRNKVGVLSSLFGFGFYSFLWKIYSSKTGRKV